MTQTITVRGMSCEGCESAVENALSGVSGVNSVDADRGADAVTIEGTAELDELVTAIEDAGYEAAASSA